MRQSIQNLDVVALDQDLSDFGLIRGQMGTVVEVLGEDIFEVEFSDDQGRTYAMAPLNSAQLIVLHTEPIRSL
jgi:hypothetical protein